MHCYQTSPLHRLSPQGLKWAGMHGPPFLQSGVPRPHRMLFLWNACSQAGNVLSMGTQLVNLKLVKITAWLEIQGAHCKIEGAHRGPRDFYHSHNVKITL